VDEGEEDVDKEYKQSVDPIELANLPTKHDKNKKFQGLGGVRNREDYAKYLLNLDVNSDYFDPKSRSMRSYDNPAEVLDNLDVIGEKEELISQDRFAAEQVELHNSELSSIALPTLTEKIYKKIKESNQSALSVNKTK
jgi:pre-mRNA-processing factor SLU7